MLFAFLVVFSLFALLLFSKMRFFKRSVARKRTIFAMERLVSCRTGTLIIRVLFNTGKNLDFVAFFAGEHRSCKIFFKNMLK